MLGLTNPDLLATQMASAGIGPEVMAPQLGLGGLIQPAPIPMPAAAQQMAATAPGAMAPQAAPSTQVASRMGGGDVFSQFMGTVKAGGLTNPNGLAAVAATGQRESQFSPGNVGRTWDDVGKPAGGIMSWRDDRLNNLLQFAKVDDLSQTTPEIQGQFFIKENPGLIARLNAAQSPQEAMREMNKAWAFKGFDNPEHPETIARFQAAEESLPLIETLGAPVGTAGSSIDFGRAGGDFSPTPAISTGGSLTQQATTLPTPPGGGLSTGGDATSGIGSSSNAAAVLNSGTPPAANAQQQTLGTRLAALGKGMGQQQPFKPQEKQQLLQPTGSAPQVGGGFGRDPQAIAQLMALLGGGAPGGGPPVPSLAAMINPLIGR